jgi:hypothetical protein
MDTMSLVLEKLKLKKQGNEFFIHAEGLLVLKGKTYLQQEIKIIKTYRFEGESDPADQAIIYVIQTMDGSMGYTIDGYGMYSSHTDDLYSDFIKNTEIITSYKNAQPEYSSTNY